MLEKWPNYVYHRKLTVISSIRWVREKIVDQFHTAIWSTKDYKCLILHRQSSFYIWCRFAKLFIPFYICWVWSPNSFYIRWWWDGHSRKLSIWATWINGSIKWQQTINSIFDTIYTVSYGQSIINCWLVDTSLKCCITL